MESLQAINKRITALSIGEVIKNQAGRHAYRKNALGAATRGPGEASTSVPSPRQLPREVIIPRLEARRHVLAEVDRKAAKVVDEVIREYHDHLKGMAIRAFEEEVERKRDADVGGSQVCPLLGPAG